MYITDWYSYRVYKVIQFSNFVFLTKKSTKWKKMVRQWSIRCAPKNEMGFSIFFVKNLPEIDETNMLKGA